MAKITFYPVGNADSTLIELDNGKNILIDYAHSQEAEACGDEKVVLDREIRSKLSHYDPYIDVVVFTHADEDHTRGAADFFAFEHASKYQSKGRVRINELWVPAALIVEEGLKGDDRVIRQEARHRLKKGSGVKVFSCPGLLDAWLSREGIEEQSARRCVVISAGRTVPGFDPLSDGLEVFVHSPFAFRDGASLQSRNDGSLFLHLTFTVGDRTIRVIMGADTTWEVLADIIRITKYYGREERLQWDIYRVAHHCSYLSLAPEKGRDITAPSRDIDWLFTQGSKGSYIISSSQPIPSGDDSAQPPHRQAANYYRKKVCANGGEFLVTMEHPSVYLPRPLTFSIGAHGITLAKAETAKADSKMIDTSGRIT